jgi:cytochrome o ubiquinol oxidase subunit 1
MIFFMAMPFVIGLMNFVVPLQLGVRDVAFPTLNSVSFWLTASGAADQHLLVVGEFARTGWLAYPPLSELQFSPGVGVDYYLWALQISGVGTLLTGINFVTTILKMRAPGMSYMRMPVFCWTALASNLLIVAAFPVLTATLAMLLLDRYLGFHFFTNDGRRQLDDVHEPVLGLGASGGLHPGPAGVRHLLGGDRDLLRQAAVRLPLDGLRDDGDLHLSFTGLAAPLLHHGRRRQRQRFFGIASMIIAVPTGVKIFNWLFTMYGGRVRFTVPMLWSIGFMVTFVIGGMTGVLLAVPPADFVLHNSLFLVAHFHNVIIGGVVFGADGRLQLLVPQGVRLHARRTLGQGAFWCWFIGFYLAFMPLYVLGLMGMTRRMQHYDCFASLSSRQGNRSAVLAWLAITFLLGAGFVFLEIREFLGMIRAGAGPDRSGFLSGFFTLVGTHGTHVSVGLIWILILSTQVAIKGLRLSVTSRLFRLGLFWHFLDIAWVGIFSVVYLPGLL